MNPRSRPGLAGIVVRFGVLLTVLAVAFLTFVLFFSTLPQVRAQHRLYGQLRTELASGTTKLGGAIDPGSPVALLEAPSIGLSQVVIEGTAASQMWAGPGHRRDTPLPGQPGNTLIYGHSVAYGGPFQDLVWLKPGDSITVTTGLGTFTYRVDGVRRPRDPLPPPVPVTSSRLTLATAEGSGWRTDWAPDHVVYVDATIVGDTRLGPKPEVASVPPAERAMQGDPGPFVPLVFWLELLAVAVGLVLWARVRWGGPQAWLVGLPVVLAAFYGVVESMAQMLPNLV